MKIKGASEIREGTAIIENSSSSKNSSQKKDKSQKINFKYIIEGKHNFHHEKLEVTKQKQ